MKNQFTLNSGGKFTHLYGWSFLIEDVIEMLQVIVVLVE